jgi:dimethylglycine dehydrogenase
LGGAALFTASHDSAPMLDMLYDGNVVGRVTSGASAHCSGVSLAFGYVPAELAKQGGGEQWVRFEAEIIGHRRPAGLRTESVLDSAGTRMRG